MARKIGRNETTRRADGAEFVARVSGLFGFVSCQSHLAQALLVTQSSPCAVPWLPEASLFPSSPTSPEANTPSTRLATAALTLQPEVEEAIVGMSSISRQRL